MPDNTLSAESSQVIRNYQGKPIEAITGGATRGINLFHSFQEFNIEVNEAAYFDNPAGINHILTRITGNNISRIFGKLGVLGNANLFIINPKGIIFGPNAALDLTGSFLATTANKVLFPDGNQFSTIDTDTSVLSINVPIRLDFNGNPGQIQVQGSGHNVAFRYFLPSVSLPVSSQLQVSSEKMLALVGGNIILEGGVLKAPGGQIELASVDRGTVYFDFEPLTQRWNLNYEHITRTGQIEL